MKPLLLLGCVLLAGTAVRAQFSLLPYAGFEQSRNTLRFGNALAASDINGNLKAGVKMDYHLKGGHSPFFNLTTSPSPVRFAFDNTGSLLNSFQQNGLQLRLEGGYQYSSKPIQLKKGTPSVNASRYQTNANTYGQHKSCGGCSGSRCGRTSSNTVSKQSVNNVLNMRLQPSLALAYIPASTQTVKQSANGFDYTAGTWKTALVPAMGFEFAKGNQRLFTLTAFYTRPLSQKEASVTTSAEGKTYAMNLQPQSTTWGLTLGVPVSFAKAKTVKPFTERKENTRTYYHRRCMQLQ